MRVVCVENSACRSRRAGRRASPASATALTVLSGSRATRARPSASAGASAGTGASSSSSSSARAASRSAASVGRVDLTPFDVGESDGRAGVLFLDVGGHTRRCRAGTTRNTGLSSVAADGIFGVEPQAVRLLVVPDGHDKDHAGALGEGLAHLLEATLCGEGVCVAEGGLLLGAELVGDGVCGVDAGDLAEGVGDHFAILDVEAVDGDEVARRGARVRDELGDDGEFGFGVDGQTGAVEAGVAHAVGVEVTAGLVADGGAVAAGSASGLPDTGARVGSEGGSIAVGLPDVHFVAASAHSTGT